MSDDFNYSKATAVRTIFAEGVHAKGQLYEEVQVCRCNGKRYYVVNCMTDPMNAGGSSGLIPSWCISDAQILRYVAQKHSCLEYIDDTKNKKKHVRFKDMTPQQAKERKRLILRIFIACVFNTLIYFTFPIPFILVSYYLKATNFLFLIIVVSSWVAAALGVFLSIRIIRGRKKKTKKTIEAAE